MLVDPNLCSTFEAVQYYALLTMVLKIIPLSLFLVAVAQLITAVPSSRKLRRGNNIVTGRYSVCPIYLVLQQAYQARWDP